MGTTALVYRPVHDSGGKGASRRFRVWSLVSLSRFHDSSPAPTALALQCTLLRLLLPSIMHVLYTMSDSVYADLTTHRYRRLLNRSLVIMERLDEEPWRKSWNGEGDKPRNWRADLKKLEKQEEEQLAKEIALQNAKTGGRLSMTNMIQLAFLAMMIYNNVFASK